MPHDPKTVVQRLVDDFWKGGIPQPPRRSWPRMSTGPHEILSRQARAAEDP